MTLDPGKPVNIAQAPELAVYRDDQDGTRFYTWPAVPRLARREDGRPDINLLLYGRKHDGVLQVTGGQLTLVTSLALSPGEQTAVQKTLAELLAAESPRESGAPSPPEPSLLAPDWLTAAVEVDIGHGLRLDGVPSMAGDNQCALQIALNAEQAKALRDDWEAGLKDLVLRYRGEVSAVANASASNRTASHSFKAMPHSTRAVESEQTISFRTTQAGSLRLTLQGRTHLTSDELHNQLEVIAL